VRRRRIYKAHPDCGWRTLRSRLPVRHRTQTGARSSRMYHTSDPVPVPRIKSRTGLLCIFGLDFLQTSPHDDALALLLAFGSANTWRRDFHPTSSVPCLAHTAEISGGGSPSAEATYKFLLFFALKYSIAFKTKRAYAPA